jgi:hypothetical protein
MNKHILLGLLLVPCLSNAMAPATVKRLEFNNTTVYMQGDELITQEMTLAGYVYTKRSYSSSQQCWTRASEGEQAKNRFDELEDAYNKQN